MMNFCGQQHSHQPGFFRSSLCCLCFALSWLSFGSAYFYAAEFDWQSGAPEDLGFSGEGLERALMSLKESSAAVLIVRHDRIALEWYASDMHQKKTHYTASLAKALVGGISLLLVLDDDLIGLEDPAEQYIDEWKSDPTRAGITVRHLATHSSGIEDAEVEGLGHFESGGWKTRFWKRHPDPFTVARDWAPMKFKPGRGFEYSNPGMAMLAYIVTVSLRGSPQKNLRTLLRERIMRPIGVDDEQWAIGYGETYQVKGMDMVANWGGGNYTARAVARVGRLMLKKGQWEGRRLISPAWAQKAVSDAGTPGPSPTQSAGSLPKAGIAWWVNSNRAFPQVPSDAFMGAGAGNQVLLVVPSLDLILVRFGELLRPESFWGGLEELLFNPICAAIEGP